MAKHQRLKAGDVCIVLLPSTNTHEQQGRRPAVIVARVVRNIASVVPFTTNEAAADLEFTVKITPDNQNHLAYMSVALVYQLRVVDTERIEQKIGELSKADLQRIKKEMKSYFDL